MSPHHVQEIDAKLQLPGDAKSSSGCVATILDVERRFRSGRKDHNLLAHPCKAGDQTTSPDSLETLPVHSSGPLWIIPQIQFLMFDGLGLIFGCLLVWPQATEDELNAARGPETQTIRAIVFDLKIIANVLTSLFWWWQPSHFQLYKIHDSINVATLRNRMPLWLHLFANVMSLLCRLILWLQSHSPKIRRPRLVAVKMEMMHPKQWPRSRHRRSQVGQRLKKGFTRLGSEGFQ